MPNYRRYPASGGLYFFTVVTYDRQPILCTDDSRRMLREAIEETRRDHPFETVAWVLLPDHLHCIWKLPDGDGDFSTRWRLIKARFTRLYVAGDPRRVRAQHAPNVIPTDSHQRRLEHYVWQRRFWEHRIRDEGDLSRHIDYVHYNPVKHGLVEEAVDWPCSTVHRPEYRAMWEGGRIVARDVSALDYE